METTNICKQEVHIDVILIILIPFLLAPHLFTSFLFKNISHLTKRMVIHILALQVQL
jgi:hypothetical protein